MSIIVGTQQASTTGLYHTINGGGFVQGLVVLTASQDLLIHRLGLRAKKSGGDNANLQIACWLFDEATGAPKELLGYTAGFVVGGEGNHEHGLAWSHAAQPPLSVPFASAAIRIPAGTRYVLGVQVDNKGVSIARSVGGPTLPIWTRAQAGNPTNPFGTFTNPTVAIPAIYAVAEVDTGPTVVLTAPPATVATAQPVIAGTFADAESGAPAYDRVRQYLIEVREQGSADLLWQQGFNTSIAQRAAFSFSQVYAGPTLSEDTYEVRVTAIGDTGLPGPASAWTTFAVEDLGSIDVSAAGPTGKLETGYSASNWQARWTHPVPLNADRAWVRILSGGQVVRSTADTLPGGVVVNVAHNAFISLTAAQAAVATAARPLPGGVYEWQMQARSTDGSLSPWSDPVPLSVNYPPNQPSGLRPASGTVHAARPQTDWLLSDPDVDDTLGVGLTSIWKLTRPNGTIVEVETNAVDPVTGRGIRTPSSLEANANGVYTWQVRGRDVSAVGTPSEFGPWSPPSIFELVTAPVLAITAPTQNAVVATSTPQVAWTIADGLQSFYRVQVYRHLQPVPFYSSGQLPVAIPAAAGSFTMPGGWLKPGTVYDADVTIWTAGGVTSTSQRRTFSVVYADANLLTNVTAGLLQHRFDHEPTSVMVAWDRTNYPQASFGGYVVSRRPSEDAPDSAIAIAHIRAPGQTSFVDHHAPPNTSLVYSVSQLRKSGADLQSSQPVEVEIEVPLTIPVLASLLSGDLLRAPIIMLNRGLTTGFERDEDMVATWGSEGKKVWFRSPEGYGSESFSLSFTIRGDARGTLAEHRDRFKAIVQSGDPFSFRTESDLVYVRIVPSRRWLSRGDVVGTMNVSLEVEEIYWRETVQITA